LKNKKTILKITAYITFGLLFTLLTSTSDKIDSLKQVIATADHDTTKAKALLKLTENLYYSNPDTAIKLSKKALKIYLELKIDKGIASAYNHLGVLYSVISDYPAALEYHKRGVKIRESLRDKQGMAASYNNIGNIYSNQSDYPLSLDHFFKALKIYEEFGDKSGALAKTYNNIGNVYKNQSDNPLALDYYFKSLKIDEELGNKQGMALSYVIIGMLCTSLYEKGDSLERMGGLTAQNPAKLLDTAMYVQQQALLINKELSDEYSMTFSLSGIGSILMKKEETSHSLEYYQQTVLLVDSIGAFKQESGAHSGLAECYEKLGNQKLSICNLYYCFITFFITLFSSDTTEII